MVMMVVYRFLHMRNLYQINQGDHINELVDYIFQNGELPDNQDCRAQMIHRCKKLILSTSKWTSNGILMYNEDNRLVKNAIFQNAWNNQIVIMRNRIKITNKEVPLVEVPNDIPAKVLLFLPLFKCWTHRSHRFRNQTLPWPRYLSQLWAHYWKEGRIAPEWSPLLNPLSKLILMDLWI